MSAFSYETKRLVKERVGNTHSELSYRTDRPFEHCHLFHGGKEMDTPDNCIFVLDVEHLSFHLYWYDHPEKIGLTKAQNIYAIKELSARVTQFSYVTDRLHEYDEDVSNCLNGWAIYYEEHEQPS